MHVVTVEFVVRAQHAASFRRAVEEQARHTLREEGECRRFDVCQSIEAAHVFLLYEIYSDTPAFDAHLRTAHFRTFDNATRDWVEQKTVRVWSGPLENV